MLLFTKQLRTVLQVKTTKVRRMHFNNSLLPNTISSLVNRRDPYPVLSCMCLAVRAQPRCRTDWLDAGIAGRPSVTYFSTPHPPPGHIHQSISIPADARAENGIFAARFRYAGTTHEYS